MKHKHDCDVCRYLGTVSLEGNMWDLHICAQVSKEDSKYDTLIARYGSEGSQYMSAARCIVEGRTDNFLGILNVALYLDQTLSKLNPESGYVND